MSKGNPVFGKILKINFNSLIIITILLQNEYWFSVGFDINLKL